MRRSGNVRRDQYSKAEDPMKRVLRSVFLLVIAGGLWSAPPARAQGGSTQFEVYGFAMLDMGYQTKQNDPDWFDVLRPTKLPEVDKEYGEDGRWFSGVRQSRLGVRSTTP